MSADTKKILQSKYFLLATILVAVIGLDQWTKYLIYSSFRWGESVPVVDAFFALTYVRNNGAAFGLLHQAPPAIRDPFFIVVPLLAMVVIVVLFTKLKASQRWVAVALSLILGGAIGNLIDRVRFGYVVDFLDFYIGQHHWPAFNVADSCIVVGVGMMFIDSFVRGRDVPQKTTPSAD